MNKEVVNECVRQIREKTDFVPEIAIVLGSGLGNLPDAIDVVCKIHYSEIEGFPISTVSGHYGNMVFGKYKGKNLVILQGRVHYYEGYSLDEVVLPVRVTALLGAKILILTNAAGGINLNLKPGELVMITDHISTFFPSPLIGPNNDEWGVRFPAMEETYSERLKGLMLESAFESNIRLREGVYLQTTGPQYETLAEVNMMHFLGADMVGMSTGCEAIAAKHMGMEICGVSCITNMAAGLNGTTLDHDHVKKIGEQVGPRFRKLILTLVGKL